MKTFAARVRDALTREEPGQAERPCCRRGELAGLVLSNARLSLVGGGHARVTLQTEHAGVARRIVRDIRAETGILPGIRIRRSNRLGGRRMFEVRLEGEQARQVMDACGVEAFERRIPRAHVTKKCCRSAFLRGIFLGCGTITDPERGYLLEFNFAEEAMAAALSKFMKAFYAIGSGMAKRKDAFAVYIKNSEDILSFLSVIGAHGAILEMENARILRDARNRANRAANCDAGNIGKMLSASERQAEAIRAVQSTIGLEALPRALREVAEERLRHAEASLEELGEMLSPRVGKSGVHHRLRRIEAIARTLGEKGKGEEDDS